MLVAQQVTDIFSLINHIWDLDGTLFEDYGCIGVGNLDATLKSFGKPVDATDRALQDRKHCINCAFDQHGNYTTYDFNELSNICGLYRGCDSP